MSSAVRTQEHKRNVEVGHAGGQTLLPLPFDISRRATCDGVIVHTAD